MIINSYPNLSPVKSTLTTKKINYSKLTVMQSVSFGASVPIDNFYRVSEKLLRGAFPRKKGLLELKRQGVDTIIDLRTPFNFVESIMISIEKIRAKKLGIKHINIPISLEGKNKPEKLQKVLDFIRNNNLTYIHCHAGKDRTGFVSALYKILEENKPIEDAIIEDMLEKGHRQFAYPKMIPNLREIAEILQKSNTL